VAISFQTGPDLEILPRRRRRSSSAGAASAAGDPATMVLLHFDGSNGFANFTDSGTRGHDFVPQNGALISTKQAKFGTSSAYVTSFEATSAGGIFGPASAGPALGSGDFVAELWYYALAANMPTGGANSPLIDFGHDTITMSGGIWIDSSALPFWINSNPTIGGGARTGQTIPCNFNAWNHLAAVRVSGTTSFYVNGALSGTPIADTTVYVTAANGPSVGVTPANQFSGPGYFDEVRVSVGTNRGYTGPFTPPSAPFISDGSTAVLLHFDGGNGSTTFTDSSSHAYAFAVSASMATLDSSQSKFGSSASLKIKTSGAAYPIVGDGSADLALGAGNFVVDFWLRPIDLSDSFPILVDWGFSENNLCPYMTIGGTGLVGWVATDPTTAIAATAPCALNTWTHIALVRSAGSTRLFINGVQSGVTFSDAKNYPIAAIGPAIGGFATHIHNPVVNFDEFRISKGTDRGWFGGFTPPTSPYSG
jgi:hypothetical protein